MTIFNLNENTHRRYNPLSRRWILVSPHREKRPWQGQVEKKQEEIRPEYDPNCYLCPGNKRAEGAVNPEYSDTFVFDNDFSALNYGIPHGEINNSNLMKAKTENGICRVVCFSPRHNLTLAEMEEQSILKIIDTWCEQYKEISNMPLINHVQIFENRGAIMGCSNPHPHGQIWATESIPEEPDIEIISLDEWKKKNNSCLLCEYIKLEKFELKRVVCENENFAVIVPFWAIWPFETILISKNHYSSLLDFDKKIKTDFASILKHVVTRYDNLFETSFPYSMGIHQSPVCKKEHKTCHFHIHFYPPLLRSATVRKFMVGYEMLSEPQRDITPETAAERLQSLSEVHYRHDRR